MIKLRCCQCNEVGKKFKMIPGGLVCASCLELLRPEPLTQVLIRKTAELKAAEEKK